MLLNAVSAPFIICVQASAEAPCSRFISAIASSRRTRASSSCCRYLVLTSSDAFSHVAICAFHWSTCALSFCTYSSRFMVPSSGNDQGILAPCRGQGSAVEARKEKDGSDVQGHQRRHQLRHDRRGHEQRQDHEHGGEEPWDRPKFAHVGVQLLAQPALQRPLGLEAMPEAPRQGAVLEPAEKHEPLNE